ncbi:hypothetical protein TEA_007014 [Camellia sinensis var. sinensis]|uniref:Uncharacterized protein n=1 Tax=Camellia sinensis var. sinensis TaxID=542762 RepID=A0A4S4DRZ6_CAMSN|nr:hypothetical protein TEA_007014 [Camellia sinensis var. sinensis]
MPPFETTTTKNVSRRGGAALFPHREVLNFDRFSCTTGSSKPYLSPTNLPLKIPACKGHSLVGLHLNFGLLARRVREMWETIAVPVAQKFEQKPTTIARKGLNHLQSFPRGIECIDPLCLGVREMWETIAVPVAQKFEQKPTTIARKGLNHLQSFPCGIECIDPLCLGLLMVVVTVPRGHHVGVSTYDYWLILERLGRVLVNQDADKGNDYETKRKQDFRKKLLGTKPHHSPSPPNLTLRHLTADHRHCHRSPWLWPSPQIATAVDDPPSSSTGGSLSLSLSLLNTNRTTSAHPPPLLVPPPDLRRLLRFESDLSPRLRSDREHSDLCDFCSNQHLSQRFESDSMAAKKAAIRPFYLILKLWRRLPLTFNRHVSIYAFAACVLS